MKRLLSILLCLCLLVLPAFASGETSGDASGAGPRSAAGSVAVTVEHGATLDLDEKANIMVSTFSGGGTVTNGDVTVISAVRAKCADLFSGKAAHFVRSLYLTADAVFEITDAENLSAYTGEERVAAITSLVGTISRRPALKLTTSSGEPAGGDGSWTLQLSADRKTLTFGSRKGLMILYM